MNKFVGSKWLVQLVLLGKEESQEGRRLEHALYFLCLYDLTSNVFFFTKSLIAIEVFLALSDM